MKRVIKTGVAIATSLLLFLSGILSGFPTALAAPPVLKPNIIVILADDLGNADLGYRGSEIRTPNIDKLANTGVRLESYYGLPVCTPARAALLTGRYPMRHGLQTNTIFPAHTYGLPTDEVTLADALKKAGYETAMVGKWHLGHAYKDYWPQNRGFDYFYGNVMGEVDYDTKEDKSGLEIDWQRNGKRLEIVPPEDGYYTELIGDEAVKLIHQHDQSNPFFLYFASLAPHTPLQAPRKDRKAYKDLFPGRENKEKRTYAAMITSLDDQVGRMLDALEEEGMRENTLIFFSTDNGGSGVRPKFLYGPDATVPDDSPVSNEPFRGGKTSLSEGGVRLPAIVNWPAQLQPAVVDEPLHHVDIMPTLLALAGGKGGLLHPFDGKDAWATLAEGAPSPHEEILINVETYRGAIIRKDNGHRWKLIKYATLPGKTELFDLSQDKEEQNNVALLYPDIAEYLEARLVAYAKEQKFSEWLKAQAEFMDEQGIPFFDPDFDVEDGGPLDQIPVLPDNF
ncbi:MULTISPECIES: arylsulfatase [unclassified Moorena]|uniref:arylsulfatase B n=1 Tax=unclassified Moorena TaxID=2683338 RepID=UPI00257C5694|nr:MULTISPECIES: arylsulfatase [unclassified Moorena]